MLAQSKKKALWIACFALLSFFIFTSAEAATKLPSIKAGTVVMANLDTPLDSDQPNALVTATINGGKYKGMKLVGQLINEEDADSESIPTLHFSSIKFNGKLLKTKSFTAYAIDFDEARIVTVRQPDYDELKREAKTLARTFYNSYALEDKIKLGTGTEFGILIMSDV